MKQVRKTTKISSLNANLIFSNIPELKAAENSNKLSDSASLSSQSQSHSIALLFQAYFLCPLLVKNFPSSFFFLTGPKLLLLISKGRWSLHETRSWSWNESKASLTAWSLGYPLFFVQSLSNLYFLWHSVMFLKFHHVL